MCGVELVSVIGGARKTFYPFFILFLGWTTVRVRVSKKNHAASPHLVGSIDENVTVGMPSM